MKESLIWDKAEQAANKLSATVIGEYWVPRSELRHLPQGSKRQPIRAFMLQKGTEYAGIRASGLIDEGNNPFKAGGFDPSKKGYFYYFPIVGISGDYIGFGITNHLENRIQEHQKNLNSNGYSMGSVQHIEFEIGSEARALETKMKVAFKGNVADIGVSGFRKECISADFKELFFKLL